MSAQPPLPLFVEDILEALDVAVKVLGGYKAVGPAVFPAEKPDIAARKLADCLNRNRRERLEPAEDAGYTSPAPIEPEDEAAALMREFNASVHRTEELVKRMERAAARSSKA